MARSENAHKRDVFRSVKVLVMFSSPQYPHDCVGTKHQTKEVEDRHMHVFRTNRRSKIVTGNVCMQNYDTYEAKRACWPMDILGKNSAENASRKKDDTVYVCPFLFLSAFSAPLKMTMTLLQTLTRWCYQNSCDANINNASAISVSFEYFYKHRFTVREYSSSLPGSDCVSWLRVDGVRV